MKHVTVLIKPASSLCNLRCSYCFYRETAQNRKTGSHGIMREETAAAVIDRAFAFAEESICFAFQGGEPTLAGLRYFQYFTKQVHHRNKEKQRRIFFTIQTNGVLLKEEWAEFFLRENFLVGLSMDGPEWLHDSMRHDCAGQGSFRAVRNAADLLNRYRVPFNILTVVTAEAAAHPKEVWEALAPYRYLQFIPYIPSGTVDPAVPHPQELANFLKTVLDRYMEAIRTGTPVSVRDFDGYVMMLRGMPPPSCALSGACGGYFTVEADGSVYPCDFYCTDAYLLGNVREASFEEMAESECARSFLKLSLRHPQKCVQCAYYRVCRGGCRRYRDTSAGENMYCDAYREFFSYALPKLRALAEQI